ncbi:MAG TPA: winged helix-turn-helix domain-containing protein [Candidatus Saccharimonadales bacterium]|nr:winged helix-turn-helix domain-containing protein [Candidatus Saccharimonadales bacterium]
MSKTWDTKRRIIKLLLKGNMTLTEISAELGLAPSTVSKHIEELNRIGAISLVDNPYIKKWKYYRANPEFSPEAVLREGGLLRQRLPQVVAVGLAVLVGIFLIYGFASHSGAQARQKVVSIELTDPPQVPAGTQALIVSYSSIKAHVLGEDGGNSSWISVVGNGTLNLMGLVNTSTIIANVVIPENDSVDMVNFSVNSARIIINGTNFSVVSPETEITAGIEGNESLNGGSGFLIDLSPTVLTVFTNDSTLFFMLPSVKAVLVGSRTGNVVGSTTSLNDTEKARLNMIGPNISIDSAELMPYGKNTTFYVTVKNNGNSSIDIRNIVLRGNFTALVIPDLGVSAQSSTDALPKAPLQVENTPDIGQVSGILGGGSGASGGGGGGNTGNGDGDGGSTSIGSAGTGAVSAVIGGASDMLNGTTGSNTTANASVLSRLSIRNLTEAANVTIGANASANVDRQHAGITNITTNVGAGIGSIVSISGIQIEQGGFSGNLSSIPKVSSLVRIGVAARSLKTLDFLVTSNGTLILPTGEGDVRGSGYLLTSGDSATFTFSGEMVIGDGQIVMSTVQGSAYNVTVVGNQGVSVSTNVTS